ncbi:MAG: galactokinase [Pseudomonadota bacterium]
MTTEAGARELFVKTFGAEPGAVASAPARANLLGEHTDYNDGFVLPTPLGVRTAVALATMDGDPGTIQGVSEAFGGPVLANLADGKREDWLDYPLGCLHALSNDKGKPPSLKLAAVTDVPIGAGVSSSAAFEVAVLKAVRAALDLEIDDIEIAKLAQSAERDFVGMPCGIMDQMAASVAQPGEALFLDTGNLEIDTVPLPDGHHIAVVHSGVSHQLVDGGYAQRVAECQAACRALGVSSLRELTIADLPRIDALPEPLHFRARHVVTENQRVLDGVEALRKGDAEEFGRLMVDSHASQRDHYAVSVPAVDALVEAKLNAGAVGARLTGGGFGGSAVSLVRSERFDDWLEDVLSAHAGAKLIAKIGGD